MSSEDLPNLLNMGIRQGAILSCNDLPTELKNEIQENRATPVSRNKPVTDDYILVLLSQDCDINNDREKYIEVVILKKVTGNKVKKPLQKTRNFQKLQVLINGDFWECDANHISHIPKESFLNIDGLNNNEFLPEKQKEILLKWRINRYTREPLPDNFNMVFLNYLRDENIGFEEYLRGNNDITDLYVFVSPQDENADEYLVSITALLNENCTTTKEDAINIILLGHITTLHENDNGLIMIQIEDSLVPEGHNTTLDIIARPEDFSMLDVYGMKRLTLDYLCFPD